MSSRPGAGPCSSPAKHRSMSDHPASGRPSGSATPLFLCIGDIDVDVMIGVDRLPTRDSKVNGSLLQRVPGGMAGNVAMALSRLGGSVRLFGRVGEDEDGAFALDGLRRAGVDTTHVMRVPDVATFSCIALITPDGEKSLVKLITAAYRPQPDDVVDQLFDGVAHAHLTSAGDPELCRRIVETAHKAGATCSLDLEFADLPEGREDLVRALEGFDFLFCNSASRITIDERLREPVARWVPIVITTLGAAGSRIEGVGRSVDVGGFATTVKDTTGAGDCFAAAFLYARLAENLGWDEALRFANCAAALSTRGYGAQSALPTQVEVWTALDR
jgi:sugar/nucleoside kinase (ribokinase family)